MRTKVRSLLHVEGEPRLFAGLQNGELVTVDLRDSPKETKRVALGGDRVRSLLHVRGEKRLFAGMSKGKLMTVDLSSALGLRNTGTAPRRTGLPG